MLPFHAAIPGTGWGCLLCELPANGAVAVICHDCLRNLTPIRFAIDGHAEDKMRVPLTAIAGNGPFGHNHDKHVSANSRN